MTKATSPTAPASDAAPESDAEYYRRRAKEALRAAERAATPKELAFHHVMAETYSERATMLAHARHPLSESERLWIDSAIAGGLAAHTKYPHARETHRRLADEYRRRTQALAPRDGRSLRRG